MGETGEEDLEEVLDIGHLEPGDIVCIRGLKSEAGKVLNGEMAVLGEDCRCATGRLPVQTSYGLRFIKYENLEVLLPADRTIPECVATDTTYEIRLREVLTYFDLPEDVFAHLTKDAIEARLDNYEEARGLFEAWQSRKKTVLLQRLAPDDCSRV